MITLEEELEHVRHYLIIQKIRYKSKFNYEMDIQDEALTCITLKLIIQPIVENAIYHGIELMPDEGSIRISVRVEGEKVIISVTDNGLGMTPQVMEKLLRGGVKSSGGSGVGVKNVHERIQLYYGKAYGLTFMSEVEEGTTVTITLPMLIKELDPVEGEGML